MHAAPLLERMQDIQANVKVSLSSEYPQTFINADFPLETLSGFLAKPYDPQVLISELKAKRNVIVVLLPALNFSLSPLRHFAKFFTSFAG